MRAWHFTGATLRDGRPVPPVGEWLEHTGPLVLCKSGLHASERLLDAAFYVPGLTLHRVTLDGDLLADDDKIAARRRRIDETREVPLRAAVRLALESVCLVAWCAGLYLPDLPVALDAADREDWEECERATWAASDASSAIWAAWSASSAIRVACRAARSAAWTASAARACKHGVWATSWAARTARVARTASAAGAVWDTIESRAIELLWGEP